MEDALDRARISPEEIARNHHLLRIVGSALKIIFSQEKTGATGEEKELLKYAEEHVESIWIDFVASTEDTAWGDLGGAEIVELVHPDEAKPEEVRVLTIEHWLYFLEHLLPEANLIPASTLLENLAEQIHRDLGGVLYGIVKQTADESVVYKLNARDGQFLSVSLTSDNESAGFNVYIPGRGPGDEALGRSDASPDGHSYMGQLYMTGDHSISVFLNRNAARKGATANYELTLRVTDNAPDAPPVPAMPATGSRFSKQVSYGGLTFTVTSPASETENRITLAPAGLQASNDPVTIEVKGFVVEVLCDDIDGDDSPEIAVITQESKQEFGRAYVFSTLGKKSLGMVNFVDVTDDTERLSGYGGGYQYQFVEGTFIRRFPLFSDGERTGKTRQFQFKLKPGEAMKQLVLDKQVDF